MDTLIGTSTEHLMPILKFTQHDLDQNRQGLLTDAQRKKVWRWQGLMALVLGLAIAGMVIMFMGYMNGPQDDPGTQAVSLTFRFIALVLFLPLIGWLFWFQSRIASILRQGKVASTTGRMHLRSRKSSKGRRSYLLGMPDRGFQVSQEVYESFIEGETYTLYYVPVPVPIFHYLLSAEHHHTEPEKQK